jgi:hypothetical protein
VDTDLRDEIREASHAIGRKVGLIKRPSLTQRMLTGVAAGAVGTSALNLMTYIDMAVRARPASETPAEAVRKLEDKAGIEALADQGRSSEQEANRRQAFGALFGFVTGLGVGALYGLIRPILRSVPATVAGLSVGLAAMAASDVPVTLLGVTDPKEWGLADWVADLVPHLAYGFATVLAFDALSGPHD